MAEEEHAMTPSDNCLDLIKEFEGCAKPHPGGGFGAYPDPASGGDPWTIGWGTTGVDVKQGMVWTQDECDTRLASDVARFAAKVSSTLAGATTNQNQFDALVCFSYNVGIGNLQSSTLLKLHKAGDYPGAKAQFVRWNKAGGKVMNGLTRRREAEAALYGTPM
jgi:lysozyme